MSSILLPLAVLACPISMIAMMVIMGRGHNDEDKTQDELSILRQRYAKGEISEAEYERMKQKLAPPEGRP